MRRTILGCLALAFLATAGVMFAGGLAAEQTLALSVCLRMGSVLGAMWLAYDQVHELVRRTPPWMMAGAALSLLVVVVRPRAILAVAPLLATAAALHWLGQLLRPLPDVKNPESKRKPARRTPPDDPAT
ncbi:MAG: hypothetical protein KDA57_15615 [Planctomycetales bacterium]|nr:hypothetical protein [Planctomycetales bacterium]